jgi:mRNA interferase YafQ
LNVYYTTQFKRDYKSIKKQQKDLEKLTNVIDCLVTNRTLSSKYRDHQLSGKWSGHRDCHIEPDWILLYRMTSDSLYLERTGSHSDLFE